MSDTDLPKQKYCYVLRLYPAYYESSGWTDEARETVSRHFHYLKDLAEKGTLILAGRTVNEPMSGKDFGIAILETSSREEAQSIMDNDPSILGKIMYAEFFEFSLALMRK